MPRHLQFHAIAIGIICLIVVAMYFLMAPEPAQIVDPHAKASGDRYVRIFTATWGRECNDNIRRLQEKPLKADENGELPPPYELVVTDNVLDKLQAKCDGYMTCDLTADTDTLGILYKELSCYRKLEVGYRCYSYDRAWNMLINQGSPLHIDCSEEADKDRAKAESESTR